MSARGDGRHRNLIFKLSVFVAGSFAFGFALVPLYDVLCTITGLGNQKSLSRAAAFAANDLFPAMPSDPPCSKCETHQPYQCVDSLC